MQEFKFKFYYLGENGQATSFFSKKGELNSTELHLDGDVIPVAAIIDADVRKQYLILSVATGEEPVGLAIQTSKAARLKSELGVLRSAVWADTHESELREKGESHRFRKERCPSCQATLDLTDMEVSPQVHCQFCHTMSTPADPSTGQQADTEAGYRLCDECSMYSRPRNFTIFYFYFLFVFYGWSSRQTWRCPGCMRGEAWKMLFGNMLFLLGLPVALVQLFRAYGGTDVGGKFRGLDAANLKARGGKIDAAIDAYQNILQQRPVSAGVKYNLGLAFVEQQRMDEAAKMFEFSLRDCSNYGPSANLLGHCYESLGRTAELEALKAKWGAVEEENHIESDLDDSEAGS